MLRALQTLLLLAAAPILTPLPAVAQMQPVTGGMNGGMTAGGMNGGMTAGGMNGGMTGMGGVVGAEEGATGGRPGYSGSRRGAVGSTYSGDTASGGASQPTQNYQCITQQGHCSVSSSPGALRHGASCTCLLGGPGKIK